MDEENRWGGISMVQKTPHFLKLIHPKPKPNHMVLAIFTFIRWFQPIMLVKLDHETPKFRVNIENI